MRSILTLQRERMAKMSSTATLTNGWYCRITELLYRNLKVIKRRILAREAREWFSWSPTRWLVGEMWNFDYLISHTKNGSGLIHLKQYLRAHDNVMALQ